jgi:cytochrome c-type biogenesis protein CcmH/NrfG
VEKSVERTQRTFIKILFVILGCIILLVAIFWGGHDLYVRWQEKRLVRAALSALQQNDLQTASLAARTVLQLRPTSIGAARVMAEIAERANDRSALDWRRKVITVAPESVTDILALARSAIQFNENETAENALTQVSAEGKTTADFHATSALLAQAKGESDKEQSEWAEAVRLAPDNKGYQLQLGTVRVRSHDPKEHQSGIEILQALRADPAQRASATRALITDGVARRESVAQLVALAKDLQSYPEATWTDHLLYLDFLHQTGDPQFSSYLTELEKTSTASPSDLTALLWWMNHNNLNLLALDFMKDLSPEIRDKWPIPRAMADVYVRLGDWKTLEKKVDSANWPDFDFLRDAYLARAFREQDNAAAAEREWSIALKQASAAKTVDGPMILLRTLKDWHWESESLDLLWAMTKNPEKEGDAMAALYQYYADKGDTADLYRVVQRRCESRPDDDKAQNNRAQLALLLDVDTERAHETAERLYQKEPGNSIYAATYSFSLYRLGKYQKAIQVMSKLKPEELNRPEIAAYYAIFLAAAGDKQKAAEYLNHANGASLLPEEKALLQGARDKISAGR